VDRLGPPAGVIPAQPADGPSRRGIALNCLGVALATGAYGISFGVLSVAAGLTLAQTCALSLLMFTGASQFAFAGLAASPPAAALTAVLLGTRNAFYGLSLAPFLPRGARRWWAAHLVIDETTAMAVAQPDADRARFAFTVTGLALYGCWNAGTLLGAVGGQVMADPKVLGFDAAAPAAFVALLAPRLTGRPAWAVALAASFVALALTPWTPAGVPVLGAAAVAMVAAAAVTPSLGSAPKGDDAGGTA
jgi:predicted branched-subunit amino acid permease